MIQFEKLSYKPFQSDEYVLKEIDLEIRKGDFALLLGPSGCGKSTLTHCFNGLIPHLDQGVMEGRVIVEGKDTRQHQVHEFASKIGLVFQNPDDQILSLKVVDEVAWGVENLGIAHKQIVERVDEFMEMLEITHLKNRLTFAISGGQKQRVSIASNLAMLQDVLILDDPTTDLDPIGKAEVVKTLEHLHREMGMTLLVIEHDLNDLIELANRIIVMDAGRVVYDGEPGVILSEHYEDLLRLGVNMPQHVEIAHWVVKRETQLKQYPTLRQDSFALLQEFDGSRGDVPAISRPAAMPLGEAVVSVRDLEFAYDPTKPVLRGLNFDIHQGEFLAIIGANGSGKTTLVNCLTGLLLPDHGQIVIDGNDTQKIKISELAKNLGYVFQNPDHQLFANSVADELRFSLGQDTTTDEEQERSIAKTLDIVGLGHMVNRHPFSLSRGQRQKLAVAASLIHEPRIILLDEPTTGQDRRSLGDLLDLLARLNKQGNTTIMVTHDMDVVTAYATRVIVMADGEVVLDGDREHVFYNEFEALEALNLRPPTIVEFCRRLEGNGFPRFLTVDDLVEYVQEVRPAKNISS